MVASVSVLAHDLSPLMKSQPQLWLKYDKRAARF